MRLHVFPSGTAELTAATGIVIPIFEDEAPNWGTTISEADVALLETIALEKGFAGKAENCYVLPTPISPYRCAIVVGLGTHADFDAEVLRRAAGKICPLIQSHAIDHLVFDASGRDAFPIEAFVEGIILGTYDFRAYKTSIESESDLKELSIVIQSEEALADLREGCARTAIVCNNVNWARDLANTPPNNLTPTILANEAEAFAKSLGLTCTIFDDKRLEAEKMNGILSVSQGSSEEARLITLEYSHPDAKQTLAMVGKGVTFDTGGISIKGAVDMHEMKFDMCGAAAVLGAMKSIGEIKPIINVIAVVPAAENKTGPEAYVPGDIITMYNGKTVEVHNTDAEGRMLLADALAYTEKTFKPNAIVDLATLTGAIVVGLGHYAAGVFSNDSDLVSELDLAADASGERIWPMPLWQDYRKLVDGTHADLCNIGPRGEAGSITAAAFLSHFVDSTRWAHVDIAGTAWGGKHISYLNPDHATGYGVRLLTQWIIDESIAETD
ncbi:MAG: leucyl aminopeptidase [Candidatus Hydrogenedentota bacterium]